jgi:hypothetical protein
VSSEGCECGACSGRKGVDRRQLITGVAGMADDDTAAEDLKGRAKEAVGAVTGQDRPTRATGGPRRRW